MGRQNPAQGTDERVQIRLRGQSTIEEKVARPLGVSVEEAALLAKRVIDARMGNEIYKETVLKGIYEIKGDALKVCYYGSKMGKRPTEFSTNDDPNIAYITLTRAKKSDKAPPE